MGTLLKKAESSILTGLHLLELGFPFRNKGHLFAQVAFIFLGSRNPLPNRHTHLRPRRFSLLHLQINQMAIQKSLLRPPA